MQFTEMVIILLGLELSSPGGRLVADIVGCLVEEGVGGLVVDAVGFWNRAEFLPMADLLPPLDSVLRRY